jgi:hypothetical protein
MKGKEQQDLLDGQYSLFMIFSLTLMAMTPSGVSADSNHSVSLSCKLTFAFLVTLLSFSDKKNTMRQMSLSPSHPFLICPCNQTIVKDNAKDRTGYPSREYIERVFSR